MPARITATWPESVSAVPAAISTTRTGKARPRPSRLARSPTQAEDAMPTRLIVKISPTAVWLKP